MKTPVRQWLESSSGPEPSQWTWEWAVSGNTAIFFASGVSWTDDSTFTTWKDQTLPLFMVRATPLHGVIVFDDYEGTAQVFTTREAAIEWLEGRMTDLALVYTADVLMSLEMPVASGLSGWTAAPPLPAGWTGKSTMADANLAGFFTEQLEAERARTAEVFAMIEKAKAVVRREEEVARCRIAEAEERGFARGKEAARTAESRGLGLGFPAVAHNPAKLRAARKPTEKGPEKGMTLAEAIAAGLVTIEQGDISTAVYINWRKGSKERTVQLDTPKSVFVWSDDDPVHVLPVVPFDDLPYKLQQRAEYAWAVRPKWDESHTAVEWPDEVEAPGGKVQGGIWLHQGDKLLYSAFGADGVGADGNAITITVDGVRYDYQVGAGAAAGENFGSSYSWAEVLKWVEAQQLAHDWPVVAPPAFAAAGQPASVGPWAAAAKPEPYYTPQEGASTTMEPTDKEDKSLIATLLSHPTASLAKDTGFDAAKLATAVQVSRPLNAGADQFFAKFAPELLKSDKGRDIAHILYAYILHAAVVEGYVPGGDLLKGGVELAARGQTYKAGFKYGDELGDKFAELTGNLRETAAEIMSFLSGASGDLEALGAIEEKLDMDGAVAKAATPLRTVEGGDGG